MVSSLCVSVSHPLLLGTPVTWDDGPTLLFILMSPVTAAKTHRQVGPHSQRPRVRISTNLFEGHNSAHDRVRRGRSLQRSGPEQKSEESKGQRVGNLLRAYLPVQHSGTLLSRETVFCPSSEAQYQRPLLHLWLWMGQTLVWA